MFDDSGRPQGYGQYSPFQDNPKAPGAVPQAKDALQTGGGSPTVPVDPTLSGWRQPQAAQRPLGGPHTITGGPVNDPQSSLMSAIMPSTSWGQSANGSIAPPDAPPAFAPKMPMGQPAAPPLTPTNPDQDWQSFVNNHNYTGTYGRTHMPQLVQEYNQQYGGHAKAGTANAKGTVDTVDFGDGRGWVDKIHGGDDAWQSLVEGANSGQRPGMSMAGLAGAGGLGASTGTSNPLIAAILQQQLQPQKPISPASRSAFGGIGQ